MFWRKRKLTREEMLKKLKELKENKKEIVESPGAMCYSTMRLEPKPYVCLICGEVNEKNAEWGKTIIKINEIVEKIKKLGYDAQLDKKEFCKKCSNETEYEKPELIFKIKYKGEKEYHQVRTNVTSDYDILLAFLENEDVYNAGCGQTIAVKKKIDTISKMLGVQFEN